MVKAYRNADSLAREHTDAAIDTIVQVMEDPFAENRDRLNAAKEILDRGHGKPRDATIAVPGDKRLSKLLSVMSDAELMALISSKELPRLTAPIEAEFTEVASKADPLLA